MDILIQLLIGLVLSWVYGPVKAGLKLGGKGAAWLLYGLMFLIAIPVTLGTQAFAGIEFNLADPGAFLAGVGQAFLILVGSASALYAVTKKRVPVEESKKK